MLKVKHRASAPPRAPRPWIARFARARLGAVSPVMAVMIVPIVGLLGFAAEASNWYFTQRSAQNAADTAALAAAANACDPSASPACTGITYVQEAAAVAKGYGFTASSTTTVTTTLSHANCLPGAGASDKCYKVVITKAVPIYLMRAVGFNGDTAVGSGRGQVVSALAIANPKGVDDYFCITTLGTGDSFRTNGATSANLSGCSLFSNGNLNCNAHGLPSAPHGWAVGTSSCGQDQQGSQVAPTPLDKFAALSTAANIPPPSGCSGATTISSGTFNISAGNRCYTGNLTISGPVVVDTGGANRVITLYNGANLVLSGGSSFTGPTNAGLTVVFAGTGSASSGAPGFVTRSGNGGTPYIDMGAPTTGTWSGIALYQDSRMSGANSLTFGGNGINALDFRITGLIYGPHLSLTIRGAINHQTSGLNCLGIMVNDILVGGGGDILATTTDCYQAGLDLNTVPGTGGRQRLVQ